MARVEGDLLILHQGNQAAEGSKQRVLVPSGKVGTAPAVLNHRIAGKEMEAIPRFRGSLPPGPCAGRAVQRVNAQTAVVGNAEQDVQRVFR